MDSALHGIKERGLLDQKRLQGVGKGGRAISKGGSKEGIAELQKCLSCSQGLKKKWGGGKSLEKAE